jgi:LPXTG-site transpeptidase (sortase) family protein
VSLAVAVGLVAALLLTWALRSDAEPVQAASAPTTTSAQPTLTSDALPEPRSAFVPTTPTPSPSATPKPKPKPKPSATSTMSGFRIKISSIGLERRMTGMGVSSNGTINPPKGKVIWFQGFGRVRPGAIGTAVIAGHVTKGGEPDTFYRLSRVDVGDTIQIVDGGKTKTYRVNRASAIDKTKVTTDKAVWGTNTSHSRLAIVTCDDALGYRSDGHRVANFVIIADRI